MPIIFDHVWSIDINLFPSKIVLVPSTRRWAGGGRTRRRALRVVPFFSLPPPLPLANSLSGEGIVRTCRK